MTSANDTDDADDRDPTADPARRDDLDLAALATATTNLVAAIGSIGDGHWDRPSPCSEWDLAALVDHVTGGNWFTLQVLAGRPADEAMRWAIERFGEGSATGEAAIRSATDQAEAFGRSGVLERSWDHVAGPLPGHQILRLRVHDLIVHTWDINQTVAPPASVPAGLVDWGLGELARGDSLTAEHVVVGSATTPPAGNGAAAGYLTAFGR